MPIVTVHAVPRIRLRDLHADDRFVRGEYPVSLKPTVRRGQFATAALDVFHSCIPVKNLDDFRFDVRGARGARLRETARHES